MLDLLWPRDPVAFWAMVGAIAIPIGAMLVAGYKRLKKFLRSEFQPIVEENKRLRQDLENRFRLPTFALDAVELTEIGAQRRIEELKAEYQNALKERDQQRSAEVQEALSELGGLQEKLKRVNAERNRLAHSMSGLLRTRPFVDSGTGFGLPTGPILLVRHEGCVGAVKAIDQAADERGQFIRYAWWYLPDGSTDFAAPSAQFGFGECGEGRAEPPFLRIGPIEVEWSKGGDGFGWVYYGPSGGSPDIALAITQEADITRVDASNYRFLLHPDYRNGER